MNVVTYYEILGVDADATGPQIKTAYHRKLLTSHPDKNSAASVESPVMISAIKEAYRVLSDSQAREKYDEELKTTFKKQGFNITGAGLDIYTLESFRCSEDDIPVWTRDCPRCSSENSIELNERDLELGTPDGLGGYQIMVPCQSCSLWITVLYEEEGEEE